MIEYGSKHRNSLDFVEIVFIIHNRRVELWADAVAHLALGGSGTRRMRYNVEAEGSNCGPCCLLSNCIRAYGGCIYRDNHHTTTSVQQHMNC
jgi:hypothetical protein